MSHSLPEGWFESGHGSIVVFVKDFRDPLERKKKLMLKPWASIKDIKDQLQVVFNVPTNAQKLYYLGRELKNAHNLQECGIYQDSAVIDFVARRQQSFGVLYGDAMRSPLPVTNGVAQSVSNGAASAARASTGVPPRAATIPSSNCNSNSSSAVTKAAAYANGKTRENVRPEQAPVINIHPYGAHLLPVTLMKITHQALQGLALGLAPVLAMDGTGGTYFFKDPSHRNVGCFKPQDEEPFGPYNPRGLVGELGQSGLRRGILSGEACERELAAYLLDKDHFAGVPATSLVEARHPVFKYSDAGAHHFKVGSLQEFVRHDDVVSDLAPSQFTVHQVHKIVLLDMRLLNTDRNDANILVRKRRSPTTGSIEYELIPIDHGYCLPQFLEIAWCDWCWFNWPQLEQPLSAADRAYVLALDAARDADALARKIPLRRACRRNMVIAGLVLQKSVRADLVLVDIARMMCRDDLDAPSTLERMCLDAFQQVLTQRRASESSPPATILAVPASPRNGQSGSSSSTSTSSVSQTPKPLKLSIDVGASPRVSFASAALSPANSGARSPPGFWASFAPFSAFDDDENGDENDSDESDGRTGSSGSRADGSAAVGSLSWDAMASQALASAAATSSNTAGTGTVSSFSSTSSLPSSFSNEPEKDEFEVLNDALDSNAQDEKLFLVILGRLIDEQVETCRRARKAAAQQNQKQQQHRGTSSRR